MVRKKKEEIPMPVEQAVVLETPAKAPETKEPGKIEKTQFSRERMESVAHYIYKHVSSIVFGVLSPKMIKKMASAKIVTPELYDKEGYPVDGGLMDVRLG